ncbi:MAG: prepilin-type N-terminal cleavage/methylation domain-containing protein [Planctomycetota bacterium]
MSSLRNDIAARDGGFTLIEILVVSGLLAVLLGALVELTSRGAELFDRGTRGQELADEATVAMRRVRESLDALAGPFPGWRGSDLPEARLIVSEAPLGLRDTLPGAGEAAAAHPAPRLQVLRSTVQLEPRHEEALLKTAVADFVERTQGPGVAEEIVAQHLAQWPRRGRGELLLLPWPSDSSGVFMELRVGERLADPELRPEGKLAITDIATVEELALDPKEVVATTHAVLGGLLHFEMEFWSQRTQSWNASGTRGGSVAWDSARAGLFVVEQGRDPLFALDRDPSSLGDARDDVWPRFVRVTMVVSSGASTSPEAYLVGALGASDTELRVSRDDELPDPAENPWLKVGAEWVKFGEVSGRRVGGLVRGGRGTLPAEHKSGDPVRIGRQVVTVIPLRCGRDSDD